MGNAPVRRAWTTTPSSRVGTASISCEQHGERGAVQCMVVAAPCGKIDSSRPFAWKRYEYLLGGLHVYQDTENSWYCFTYCALHAPAQDMSVMK